MDTRLRKVCRDLLDDRLRALLVLVALVVGGWGVASVIASTTVVEREVRDNYLATNPLHATLWYRGEGDVAAAAESARWVTQAERRTAIPARARGGFDGRLPVVLTLVDDFDRQRIATFGLEQGRWPRAGEIALERDDLTVLGVGRAPDALQLQLAGGEWTTLPVSGVVHDAGKAPARMEHCLYVYAPPQTARTLGARPDEQGVIVRMAAPAVSSLELARGHASLLGRHLEKNGFEIVRIDVPEPERHPHHGQMTSMMFLQVVFGGLAMLLSGVVVLNMISSMMQRHVAQVGVMKAVGGTPAQIARVYLLLVLVLSVLALAITIPFGFGSGLQYAKYVIAELNFDVLTPGVPWYGWLLFVGASAMLPLAAAAVPILRGLRVPVREALGAGSAPATGFVAARPGLPVAVRNVARRPMRTALTVLSLAIGLASLASAFHVGASMRETMEVTTRTRPYDLTLVFERPVDEQVVADAFAEFGDVLESWRARAGGVARLVRDDGTTGDAFGVLVGDPFDRPPAPVIDGTWRLPPEGRAVVVNTRFAAAEHLAVGDVVTLRTAGVESRWPVGALMRQLGGGAAYLLSDEPLAFAGVLSATAALTPPSAEALARATGAKSARRPHGHGSRAPALSKAIAAYQAGVVEKIEVALESAGVPVRMASTKAELVAGLEDHIYVMTRLVAIASLVVIAIGGLGLASSMSVNVLERTREIGVLRSIGATPSQLAMIFAAEAGVIGVLGLILGVAASYPLGRAIADHFGDMMFKAPLDAGTSLAGAAWAIGIVVVLVALVTVAALVQTLRQSASAALRYE